ncbi:Alpha/Beta hydrolase protein [Mycena latifolia]|nr:Alpha/Beta hydrolase protein [Mycena latifolia]
MMVQLARIGMFLFALAGSLVVRGRAAPAPRTNQGITTISTAQVAAYRPYTFFASTGYCPPNSTLAWSCGVNCAANPDFKPVAAGGEGEFIQYWFVGYSPSLERVIVSHEGTRLNAIVSMLTDASLLQATLDSALFPGIGSDIWVHSGFAAEHAKTAASVLDAVKTALAEYGADHVTVVGHSLGGALALLDSLYLPLHLPASVTFNTVAYGLPRVGNQAFADYVDIHLSLTHINNQKDVVPIIPGNMPWVGLNYRHPAGEIHIQASGEWDSCPGQENDDELCTVGDVPNILVGSIANHDGPYDGVKTSCTYLTG